MVEKIIWKIDLKNGEQKNDKEAKFVKQMLFKQCQIKIIGIVETIFRTNFKISNDIIINYFYIFCENH